MTVIDKPSRQQDAILNLIKSKPDGIHLREIGRILKIPNPTLVKGVKVLENDRGLIFHEQIKNRDVYKFRYPDDLTFKETQRMYSKSLEEITSVIFPALSRALTFGIPERLEVYRQVVSVLALVRYNQQSIIDIDRYNETSIPNDLVNYIANLEQISRIVNIGIGMELLPFYNYQINQTINESLKFLRKVLKSKKGKPSKHIKVILEGMKTNPEVYSKFKKIETNLIIAGTLLNESLKVRAPALKILKKRYEKSEITKQEYEKMKTVLGQKAIFGLSQLYLKNQKHTKTDLRKTTKTGVKTA